MIQKHADQKPCIVFCATRKDVLKCAKSLAKTYDETHRTAWPSQQNIRVNFKDKDLNDIIPSGVAFHHAGLELADRALVEDLFIRGSIFVIVATSTLAVGVNLPVHLVILKNTLTYVGGSFEEYSDLEILQMGTPVSKITQTSI